MKTWKHFIIAGFLVIFTIVACDNGNNPAPTYESIDINKPTAKIETIFGKTFYGSGIQFTARVNGNNNPNQTITWTIEETVDIGTTIVNGVLIIAVEDHGKTLTLRATSTVDTNISKTMSITAVRCLPSDFYGTWVQAKENPVQQNISSTNILIDFSLLPNFGDEDTILQITDITTSMNDHETLKTQYPCGFIFSLTAIENPYNQFYQEEDIGYYLNNDGTAFNIRNAIYTKN